VSERFASHAARLAGLVSRQLMWRPADFWAATPAEIAAIFSADPAGHAGGIDRHELTQMMERDGHG
jgi:Phage tail assembly chaperone protein, TAC